GNSTRHCRITTNKLPSISLAIFADNLSMTYLTEKEGTFAPDHREMITLRSGEESKTWEFVAIHLYNLGVRGIDDWLKGVLEKEQELEVVGRYTLDLTGGREAL